MSMLDMALLSTVLTAAHMGVSTKSRGSFERVWGSLWADMVQGFVVDMIIETMKFL